MLCGRYEGIDQRVIDYYNFEEISIGDYVVTGGESAAIVLLESVLRLIPNVLGGIETLEEESFSDNTLLILDILDSKLVCHCAVANVYFWIHSKIPIHLEKYFQVGRL